MISPVNISTYRVNLHNVPMKGRNDNVAENTHPKTDKSSGLVKTGLISVGVLAACTGLYFLLRGKKSKLPPAQQAKIDELINNNVLDKKTADLFVDLLTTRSFKNPHKMYEKLVQYMGYKTAPKLMFDKNLNADAMYNFIDGTITVGKNSNFSTLYHELLHFSQFEKLYRGKGKQAILDARIEGIANGITFDGKYLQGKMAQAIFNKPFSEVTDADMAAFLNNKKINYSTRFNDKFYEKVAVDQGDLSQEDLNLVEKYLEALKAPKKNDSFLEKEAYRKQIDFDNKLRKLVSIFED